MKLALDTSAYSEIFRGNKLLASYLQNDIVLSTVVLGELRAGFLLGSSHAENEKLLQRFLDQPNITVLSVTNETTAIYAQIFTQLRKAGTPIGTNDMWIAAICIENDLPLLTLDQDFSRVDGLKCLDTTQNN